MMGFVLPEKDSTHPTDPDVVVVVAAVAGLQHSGAALRPCRDPTGWPDEVAAQASALRAAAVTCPGKHSAGHCGGWPEGTRK